MKQITKILVFLGLVFSLVSAACTLPSMALPSSPTETEPPLPTAQPTSPPPAVEEDNDVAIDLLAHDDLLTALYKKVNPGVVAIGVFSEEGGSGLGSGFVFDDKGHIITNYHVVRSATDLEVDFPSGLKTRGTVIGTDADSDIAVVKVDVPPEKLSPLPLGDSDALQVGQAVVAIGNPHGLDGSMSTGIVSSLGRTMDSLHEAPGGAFFTAGDIIQTDAAINPGNSGGPLLNLDGQVIGINVAIQAGSFDITGQPVNSGIGFSIPINIVKRVVPSLIANGSYDYPYIGISSLGELNLFQQEALNLPQSTGVYIIEVVPNSPADEAGLRGGSFEGDSSVPTGGDLIIAIDDQEVRNFNDLISYLVSQKGPGDTVTLTVLRNGEEKQIDLTLSERP